MVNVCWSDSCRMSSSLAHGRSVQVNTWLNPHPLTSASLSLVRIVKRQVRPTDVTVAGHLHVDQPKLSLLSTSESVMVLFFSSTGMHPSSTYLTGLLTICAGLALDPPVTLYMGRDKVESNQSLLPLSVFHVNSIHAI